MDPVKQFYLLALHQEKIELLEAKLRAIEQHYALNNHEPRGDPSQERHYDHHHSHDSYD